MYKVVNSKNNQSVSDDKKPLQLITEIIPISQFEFKIKIIHPNSNEIIFEEIDNFQSLDEASNYAKEKKQELSKVSKNKTFFEKKTYIMNDKKNKMDQSYE